MANTKLHHPLIGEVQGVESESGVVQYRGLQYATLKDRFSTAVLKEYKSGDKIDATKLGQVHQSPS